MLSPAASHPLNPTPPTTQSADGLTAARAHVETGLLLLSYVVSITRLPHKRRLPDGVTSAQPSAACAVVSV